MQVAKTNRTVNVYLEILNLVCSHNCFISAFVAKGLFKG